MPAAATITFLKSPLRPPCLCSISANWTLPAGLKELWLSSNQLEGRWAGRAQLLPCLHVLPATTCWPKHSKLVGLSWPAVSPVCYHSTTVQ